MLQGLRLGAPPGSIGPVFVQSHTILARPRKSQIVELLGPVLGRKQPLQVDPLARRGVGQHVKEGLHVLSGFLQQNGKPFLALGGFQAPKLGHGLLKLSHAPIQHGLRLLLLLLLVLDGAGRRSRQDGCLDRRRCGHLYVIVQRGQLLRPGIAHDSRESGKCPARSGSRSPCSSRTSRDVPASHPSTGNPPSIPCPPRTFHRGRTAPSRGSACRGSDPPPCETARPGCPRESSLSRRMPPPALLPWQATPGVPPGRRPGSRVRSWREPSLR